MTDVCSSDNVWPHDDVLSIDVLNSKEKRSKVVGVRIATNGILHLL